MTTWATIHEQNAREGREDGHDTVGFYKMSLAKGAPDVGALIYCPCPIEMNPEFWNPLDRPLHLCAMINGKDVDVWRVGDRPAVRISQAEYEFLIADRAWAAQYDPDSPEAHPYRKESATPKSADQPNAPEKQNIRDISINSLMP